MTKMKSRKMTKSTFAIIIMGIAMVAMLAFGGTFAYFTATTNTTTQEATLAKVILKNSTAVTVARPNLLPGDVIIANNQITFSNESTVATIVFVTMVSEVEDANGSDLTVASLLNITDPSGWSEYEPESPDAGTKIYYKTVNAIADQTAPIAETVAFGAKVIVNSALLDVWAEENSGTANYISENRYMGASVTVTISANSVQAKGFVYEDAAEAQGTEGQAGYVPAHVPGDVDTSKLALAYATARQTVS